MDKPKQHTTVTDLLSAPLVAVAEANSKMALTQTNFMLEFCFDKQNDAYVPKMLKMQLKTRETTPDLLGTENGETIFNIPMLTLVPLNSLTIDKGNINLKMQVNGSRSTADGLELTATIVDTPGDISPTSTAPILQLDIEVGQLPLPKGILTTIDALNQSITPIKL